MRKLSSSSIRAPAEALVAPVHEQIFQSVVHRGEGYRAAMEREIGAACALWRETVDAETRALAIDLVHRGVALQDRIIAAAERQDAAQTAVQAPRRGFLRRLFG
jgi:hypothetical protein